MKKLLVLTSLLFSLTSATAFADNSIPSQHADLKFSATDQVSNGRGYYETEVTPGSTKSYDFTVTNVSASNLTFIFYPSDCIPAQNGGKDFRGASDTNSVIGLWAKEKQQTVSLNPGESKQLTINVEVPVNIDPGQYVMFGAIQEEPKETPTALDVNTGGGTKQTLATAIKVVNKTGVQIVMDYNIANAKHALAVNSIKLNQQSSGTSELLFTEKNDGTILEKPKGKVTVLDSSGKQVLQSDYSADSIYGGTTAQMSIPTNQVFPSGKYSTIVTTEYQGKSKDQNFTFDVTKQEEQASVQKLADSGKIQYNPNSIPSLGSLKGILIIIAVVMLSLITAVVILAIWLFKSKKQKLNKNTDSQGEV
jgi:hypothetical protein